ncbi:hypothetical protein FQN60_003911 [Etheostoma spectabile]|uniref:Uncharacterized protein n=1 Tax=Etheostoma spectabile TaxID=54343 RepID=A0A5J5CTW6_9PERO|nr:hypothetical protein FQN60_003911 [Etheostoma spectabile]
MLLEGHSKNDLFKKLLMVISRTTVVGEDNRNSLLRSTGNQVFHAPVPHGFVSSESPFNTTAVTESPVSRDRRKTRKTKLPLHEHHPVLKDDIRSKPVNIPTPLVCETRQSID